MPKPPNTSNHHWIFVAVLLCHFAVKPAISAEPDGRYSVRVWKSDGTDEGLPENTVVDMTQTRDGYLWLGTLDGLARFDGVRFAKFNTPGLSGVAIVKLFEDSKGNLWVGTDTDGVMLVKDGKVIQVPVSRHSHEGRLMSICEDATGAVWLYFADGQLARYHDGKGGIGDGGRNLFSYCRAVIAEKSGPMYLGTDHGMFSFNPRSATESTIPPMTRITSVTNVDFLLPSQNGGFWCFADGRVEKWLNGQRERDFGAYPWHANVRINAACEDQRGQLVVGTSGDGVWWYNGEGVASRVSDAQGLSHNTILSLTVDREGNLWVGTDGRGLDRVKRSVFTVVRETEAKTVQSVCEDAQGGLLFGVYGGGVMRWRDGVGEQLGIAQRFDDLSVRSVLVDRRQVIWVGVYGRGLLRVDGGVFSLPAGYEEINLFVSALHEDRRGILWVGTQGGLARRNQTNWTFYASAQGLSSDNVQAITDDAAGNLWIGTSGGLNVLRGARITAVPGADGRNSAENISALLMDEAGVLWIGTRGSGLQRWHQGKWTQYTRAEGLVSDSIGYLVADQGGNLWMGSPAGLMRVPKQSLNDFAQGSLRSISCRNFGESDGLPTSECSFGSQPAACRTHDGKLWLPTISGLVSVDPTQIKSNTNQPPVVVESVSIEGEAPRVTGIRSRPPERIIVPARREHLEIKFTCLNLFAAEQSRFKYRLEGHEKGWTEVSRSEAGSTPTARYTKLLPGDYTFRVTACNEDGVWNDEGASLAITVLPPFWRTWWFLTASAICLLGAIVGVVHYVSTQNLQRQLAGMRQQQALEKERARIARDIHDQLGASLTQVSLLGEMVESDKDSPEEVGAHARQISQTARDTTHALDEIVWTVNPSNDTLDGLVNYICKYAQDYLGVAGLRFRLDIPSQLPAADISPEVRHNVFLTVKEAITNVVRHAHAKSVWIRLRLESASFILEIQDDGPGITNLTEKMAGARNGLRNMGRRMEDIGGQFDINPAPEGGTLVRLTVPIRKT